MNVKIDSHYISIIILASFLLAACSGSPAKQGGVTIQEISDFPYADPSTVVKSGDSEIGMGLPETLPKGLSKDVPIHPGHIMNWVMTKAAGHSNPSFNISIDTSADNAAAIAWYKSKLEAVGWKIESEKDESGIPAKANEAQKTVEIQSKNGSRSLNVSFYINTGTPFVTRVQLDYREGN